MARRAGALAAVLSSLCWSVRSTGEAPLSNEEDQVIKIRSGSGEFHQEASIFDVLANEIASDVGDCQRYMEKTSCRWTQDYACPQMPHSGLRGYAVEDGTQGFLCCCTYSGWTGSIVTAGTSTITSTVTSTITSTTTQTSTQTNASARPEAAALKPDQCHTGGFDWHTSYPGNALRVLTDVEDAGECCRACRREPRCQAWTWGDRSAGHGGEFAHTCTLKGNAPRQLLAKVPDHNFVSGVVGSRALRLYRPPRRQSLYCFSLFRADPGNYEPGLLRSQYELGAGIFDCDEYDLYSNRSVEVAPGVQSVVVDVDLKCQLGGEFRTALNTEIFIKVWQRLYKHKRFLAHEWTVKVDPDAVFFASRLRSVVGRYEEHHLGVYLNNCKFGLHGPIEVFSREAVKQWVHNIGKCGKHFWDLCSGDCYWGEDMFMDQCLMKVVGSRRVDEPESLLVEDHCAAPAEWKHCRFSQVVALHPFKDRDSYLQCYHNAMEAGLYEWTVHAHEDYPGKGDVGSFHVHDGDVEKVKRFVEQKGYTGFALADGKAFLKSTGDPISEGSLTHVSKATYYLFGPPKGGFPVTSTTTTTPVTTTTTSVTTTHTSTMTTTTTTTLARLPCFAEAEPVYKFRNRQTQEQSFHMDGPWLDEIREGEEPVFYAFRSPVEGTVAIYLSAEGLKDHILSTKPDQGREAAGAQFYAFKEHSEGVEPIYAFWRESEEVHTYHAGEAMDGERRTAVAFYALTKVERKKALHIQDCAFLRPCLERDVVFTPSASLGPGTTERDMLTCQARCQNTPKCAHFSYLQYDRSCHLTTADARREYQNTSRPGTFLAFKQIVSGPPVCTPVISRGWHEEDSGQSVSWARWRQEWRGDEDPAPGLYVYNSSEVAMREAFALEYEGLDECYNWRKTYQPFGLPNHGRTLEKSMADCLQRCISVPGCLHYTWFLYDGGCSLSGEGARAVSSEALSAVSGARKCSRSRMTRAVALSRRGRGPLSVLEGSLVVGDHRVPVVTVAMVGATLFCLLLLSWRYRKLDCMQGLSAAEMQLLESLGPERELSARAHLPDKRVSSFGGDGYGYEPVQQDSQANSNASSRAPSSMVDDEESQERREHERMLMHER